MKRIIRQDYPELDRLLWDMRSNVVEPKVAFAIYERRWSYVAENALTTREKTLIKTLTKNYGKGIFMPLHAA